VVPREHQTGCTSGFDNYKPFLRCTRAEHNSRPAFRDVFTGSLLKDSEVLPIGRHGLWCLCKRAVWDKQVRVEQKRCIRDANHREDANQDLKRKPHARHLTVKLRGRTEAPDQGAEGAQFLSARGAKPKVHHGPLQRLLGFADKLDHLRLSKEPRALLNAPGSTRLKEVAKARTVKELDQDFASVAGIDVGSTEIDLSNVKRATVGLTEVMVRPPAALGGNPVPPLLRAEYRKHCADFNQRAAVRVEEIGARESAHGGT
jgi:hypothetical protein